MSESNKESFAYYFLYFVSADQFSKFIDKLCELHGPEKDKPNKSYCPNPDNEIAADRLWNRLSAALPDIASTAFLLPLPYLDKIIVRSQSVAVIDDGKATMTAQVQAPTASLQANLLAILQVPAKVGKAKISVLSKTMSFDSNSGLVGFTFPSLQASGIAALAKLQGMQIQIVDPLCSPATRQSLCQKFEQNDATAITRDPFAGVTLPVMYAVAKGAPGPVPDFTFVSSAKQIVTGPTATAIVAFPTWGKEPLYTISVDGADISQTSAGILANGQVKVAKGSGAITLSFTNILPNVPVSIKADTGPGSGSVTLPFVVAPAPNASKTASGP